MKQSEIVVGGVYHARVSGKFVHVRVDSIGENYSGRTTYAVTNLMTGRKTTFRSAMKFRRPVIRQKPAETDQMRPAGSQISPTSMILG